MKKIALLLALVMMLAICAVAAGCDPAKPAESSEPAATESSEAPAPASTEESAPASSEAEPEPESSEPEPEPESSEAEPEPESSEPEPEPSEDEPETSDDQPADNANLALGKPYTASELFRMGGADVDWGYDANANPAYPDENGTSLTDGVAIPEEDGYGDPVWAGFNTQTPSTGEAGYAFIRVDLGEKKSMKKFVITVGSKKIGSGVAAPSGFEVWVSDDGKEFEQVGSEEFKDTDKVSYVTTTLKKSAKGRYVEFRINPLGYWMFVSEVEIY